jgi:hypothetical protein
LTALSTLSGCFLFQTGSATTEGQIGGRNVNVGATVFAWWDTTDFDVDGNGNVYNKTRDSQDQELHIMLFGFAFNPREDRRFWSIDQYYEFLRNLELYDSLSFVVGAASNVSSGTKLSYSTAEPPTPGDQPYLQSEPSLNLGLVKVNETNEYPKTVKVLGSVGNHTLEIKKSTTKAGENLEGSFLLKIEKGENQLGTVVTGSVKGDFVAPVLHERIAECNFDNSGTGTQGVDPCADLEYDGVNQ